MPNQASKSTATFNAQDISLLYQQRIAELTREEATLERKHKLLGYVRLALAVAVVVLLFFSRLYLLLPLVAFGFVARVHGAALTRLAATRRTMAMVRHGLDRVEERWQGKQPRSPRISADKSLYAADLDLFGPASLFELLCEARTTLGEDCLAAWLLFPAEPVEVLRRQAAVTELRSRLPLREAFARAPGPGLASIDLAQDRTGSSAQPTSLPSFLTVLAPLLTLAAVAGVWRFLTTHSPLLLFAVLVTNAALLFALRGRFRTLFPHAEKIHRSTGTASFLLGAFEAERFTSPLLLDLQSKLQGAGVPASDALARLASLSSWIDARGNYLVRLLDFPLLYSLQLGLVVEKWQQRYGEHLPGWLKTLGQIEALVSLAAYSLEHPDDVFPSFSDDKKVFLAEELGHPLLPATTCVRNPVRLEDNAPMLLISGSNMSGKSTLLRSVGVAAVLALAGGPVRARSLRLYPFQVACSIQVQDSLQAGQSRFYAEILRLRAITEAARRRPPVLFLLDELLAGTNSADRLAGARGLVRELLRSGARGALSTHDLALVALPDEVDYAGVHNMHLQDQVREGELYFDFQLREGPVQRSNGIALMRLIGLDV